MKHFLAFCALYLALTVGASAQTSPNLIKGQVLTAAQWNQLFINKQDTLGYTPLNTAGGVMTGRLTLGQVQSGASTADFNMPPGAVPASPVNGDMWMTTAGLFAQVNGSTIGPFSAAGGGSFAGTTPITVSFPAGVVTYACPTCGVTGQPLSQFASTTSAQLRGIISDETGTGVAVFGTGPTLTGVTITTSFSATGLLHATDFAAVTANTVLANVTGSSASPTFFGMPSCIGAANALQWVNGTGFTCQAITAAAGSVAVGTTTVTGGTIGNIFYHASGNLLGEMTTTGSGTVAVLATGPAIVGGSHTAITSLGIRSTGTGAFDMTIANTENLTAGRTLTVTLNDAARTINLAGNLTLANAFTTAGGQTLTLTTTTATNVTMPASGTGILATLAGTEAFTNHTYNGMTITSTTGTFTLASGKTLTYNNSITIAGTDSTTMTFPTTSATIARTDAGQTFTGTQTFSGAAQYNNTVTITSASANALAVGLNGTTNPAFNVDASTASSATGWNIKSAAAAGGAALSVLSSGTNENGTIDAKGSGTLTLNGTATGGITLARAVTLNSTINNVTITAPGSTATLTIGSGKTHAVNNSITLAGTDSTTWTGASSNMTLAALNLQNQIVTGGATVTIPSALTTSFTANCGLGPLQSITGPTSAWSITAPANDGSCNFLLTNAASSAVAPTFSGFSVGSNTGATITTVGSAKFTIFVWRINGTSGYSVYAHQ